MNPQGEINIMNRDESYDKKLVALTFDDGPNLDITF